MDTGNCFIVVRT